MNPVFRKFSSALEMALQLQILAKLLVMALAGTLWNLGIIFYMGGGKVGFLSYLVLVSILVIMVYLYMIISVFTNPSKLSEFKAIKIGWNDVYQMWKD